jgi:hypothetical protein
VVEIVEEPARNNLRLVLAERIKREDVGRDTLVITVRTPHRIGFRD